MNRPFWTSARQPEPDSCDSVEPLISLYADGIASADESQRVEAHLPECESCRASLLWAQATHRALASRPVAMPPAYLRARIAQSLAASQAPLSARPARAFVLRPAYAAAASLSVLGVVLGYGLLHHPSPNVHPVTPRPNMVAVLPHDSVQPVVLPAVKLPHRRIQLPAPIMPFSPYDVIDTKNPDTPAAKEPASVKTPEAQPVNRIRVVVKSSGEPILHKKPIEVVDHVSRTEKRLPQPVLNPAPKSSPAPDNTATVMAKVPRPAAPALPISPDPVSVPQAPTPAHVMIASVETGGLLGAVREQAARLRGETVKSTRAGIREAGYGLRTAALDESGTAAIVQGNTP